jgi:hypothetical protein
MELILKNVRIAFPTLFEAEDYQGDGKFNYSAKFFVPEGSDEHRRINQAIREVIAAKWPKKADFMFDELKMDKKAFCYIDGKRVEYAGSDGNWILTAKRREQDGRPVVIDQRKHPLQKSDGKPYAGSYVNVKVDIWAQDGDNKGVRCTLITVQFARDGEAFGGAKPADADGFDDISDSGDAGGDDDLI